MSRLAWGVGFCATVTIGFRLLIAILDRIARWRQGTTVACTCGWTRTRRNADRAARLYIDHREYVHGRNVYDFEEAT